MSRECMSCLDVGSFSSICRGSLMFAQSFWGPAVCSVLGINNVQGKDLDAG